MVEQTYRTHKVKLQAGHMTPYPSTSLHLVKAVTRGVRIASFFWIQRMARDGGQRSLLFDLDVAIQQINRGNVIHPVSVHLAGVYQNLNRRWADA